MQVHALQRDHGTETHRQLLGPQHVRDARGSLGPAIWHHERSLPFLRRVKIEKTKLTAWPNDPRRPRMEVARSIWTLRIMASRIVRPVTRSSAKELVPRIRNPSLIIPDTQAPMQAPTMVPRPPVSAVPPITAEVTP